VSPHVFARFRRQPFGFGPLGLKQRAVRTQTVLIAVGAAGAAGSSGCADRRAQPVVVVEQIDEITPRRFEPSIGRKRSAQSGRASATLRERRNPAS